MKKIICLLLFILSFSVGVSADEYKTEAPEIYCYSTHSNGHSAVNVIIKNDDDILKIANMDENELEEEFSMVKNDSLQIQFDYSINNNYSWNCTSSWEPDRAGFFKSPLSLRVSADSEIIERTILDLGYDEYLNLLSRYAYKGNSGGWKNVNLYDFSENPVYIRARFIYTLEDPQNGKYINFISPWSEGVKVSERIIIDEEISAPILTVISTADEILEKKEMTIRVESNAEINKAMMQLSHYDGKFEIFAAYRTDENEYVASDIPDKSFNGTKEITFPVEIPEGTSNISVRCCLDYHGSEKYGLNAISTFYADINVIFDTEPHTENPQKENEEHAQANSGDEQKSTPIMFYIIPAIIISLAAGIVVIRKRK